MVMDGLCGYGVNGYGSTPLEAIQQCEKAYDDLTKYYRDHWNDGDEYATFEGSIDYFAADIKEIKIPSFATNGMEDVINSCEILKIIKQQRK
tara:strand:- start:189 stop:464 length:276 start_codon:yes stop_codon:yes gene_type:complete